MGTLHIPAPDPAELRRLVDALKAGERVILSMDAQAFRQAPYEAIRELRAELDEARKA